MKLNQLRGLLGLSVDGGKSGGFALPSDPEGRRRWFLAAAALGLIIYAYVIVKSCHIQTVPASLVSWLFAFWGAGDAYAHGYLVPIIASALFVWRWKSKLHAIPLTVSNTGLTVVTLAMLLYWVGVRAANPRIVAASLPVLVFGMIFYLAGWRWAKELWFPCAFLVFMIPVNFLEPIVAFPLRMFVAEVSTSLLNGLGMEVYREGTGIFSKTGRFAPLDVADPCSGIRSLVALMALTSLYGYVTMDKAWKKWLLFLSSMPLAVIGNLARITTVALVAQGFGQQWAMTIYHDYSGYIVFSLAILCMIALGTSLNIRYRELIYRWTQEEVAVPLPPRRPAK